MSDQLSRPGSFRNGLTVAEIIQRVRLDLVMLKEFDFDTEGSSVEIAFAEMRPPIARC